MTFLVWLCDFYSMATQYFTESQFKFRRDVAHSVRFSLMLIPNFTQFSCLYVIDIASVTRFQFFSSIGNDTVQLDPI